MEISRSLEKHGSQRLPARHLMMIMLTSAVFRVTLLFRQTAWIFFFFLAWSLSLSKTTYRFVSLGSFCHGQSFYFEAAWCSAHRFLRLSWFSLLTHVHYRHSSPVVSDYSLLLVSSFPGVLLCNCTFYPCVMVQEVAIKLLNCVRTFIRLVAFSFSIAIWSARSNVSHDFLLVVLRWE